MGVAQRIAPMLAVGLALAAPCAAAAADRPAGTRKLVVVEGDSIAHGAWVPDKTMTFPSLLADALPGVDVIDDSRNGESLEYGQPGRVPHAGMAYTWASRVLARDPDVIVLISGTNDVRFDPPDDVDLPGDGIEARVTLFERHLRRMLDTARAHTNPDGSHPAVIVMSPPPARDPAQVLEPRARFRGSRPRADLEALVRAEGRVLADYPDVTWVNNYERWGRIDLERGEPGWAVHHLTVEGVHPNRLGHELIFRTLLPAVREGLGRNPPLRTATPPESTAPRPGG
jgi:lysophospholipase L1-like esterase